MIKKLTLFLSFCIAAFATSLAQDTLPGFTVKNVGSNRIIISWTNNFENVRQISIQRSADSLLNYKSILTVADPMLPQNGFMDTKAAHDKMFYRLYILLDKGVFLFSNSKRPEIDTSTRKLDISVKLDKYPGPDSINVPGIGINNKTRPDVFVPSIHVYTHKDGYVRVNLPDDEDKKYSIRFFKDDGSLLFELKEIKERTFKIDKSSFYHSGWFRFELYEKDKLIEKHKFFLEKEF
jgi:hypothetical protein